LLQRRAPAAHPQGARLPRAGRGRPGAAPPAAAADCRNRPISWPRRTRVIPELPSICGAIPAIRNRLSRWRTASRPGFAY